ncbi:MAG: hypothetical protein IJN74_01700 [Clostridia bacterium]|nr:hypothetical protein [Clostridia bacterium]
MKTVFVINPIAGGGKKTKELIEKIREVSEHDVEIYITKAPHDAAAFVKSFCAEFGGARFIACGGDGTLNEVLNGAAENPDAEIGVIPIGSGNDFCRAFCPETSYEDIRGQVSGASVSCDAIRYKTETDKGVLTGYCANMFNIGFDCNVADLKNKMEKLSFIPGPFSYILSIFVMLIRKKGANLKIEIDGEEKHSGKLLLSSIANGCYCGGGIKSNPRASVCSGRMNINIIKNVSRLRFLSLLPHYAKGRILSVKNIDDILCNVNCSKATITPLDGKMKLCIDGEIIEAGKTEFEIEKGAFRFILPGKKVKKEITA